MVVFYLEILRSFRNLTLSSVDVVLFFKIQYSVVYSQTGQSCLIVNACVHLSKLAGEVLGLQVQAADP